MFIVWPGVMSSEGRPPLQLRKARVDTNISVYAFEHFDISNKGTGLVFVGKVLVCFHLA